MVSKTAFLLLCLSLLMGLYGGLTTPGDMQIPVHFAADGTPDGFAPPWQAFMLTPGVQTLCLLILWLMQVVEPRRDNLRASHAAVRPMVSATMALITMAQLTIVITGKGWVSFSSNWIISGLGFVFIILGNYMPKIRPNFMAGIRTPWTLSSDTVWQKTHRMAGIIFVLAGFFVVAIGFISMGERALHMIMATAIISALMPVGYSYILWRREQE